MIKTLQRRFALSRQGAVDLIKGCLSCLRGTGYILYASCGVIVLFCY